MGGEDGIVDTELIKYRYAVLLRVFLAAYGGG
jgi:hypothetical protein